MGLIRQFFQTASIDMKSQKAPLYALRFSDSVRMRETEGKYFEPLHNQANFTSVMDLQTNPVGILHNCFFGTGCLPNIVGPNNFPTGFDMRLAE